jgi:hypothetical protein
MSRSLPAVAALVCAGAVAAPAQTVDEIVARNAAARGGTAAWRAVQSMRFAGRMEIGKGMAVPFRLELKRPRKMRLEFDFQGSTAVQTYDGSAGWKLAPYLGRDAAKPLSEAELASAAGQAELDGPLIDYAAKGNRLEIDGKETLEGREAHKLKLTLKNGAVRHVYVDVETGLEAMVETPYQLRAKDKPLRTYYRDYRAVGGLLIPHLLESRVEGAPRSHKLTIASVELNERLADMRFGKPSPVTTAPPRTAVSATSPLGASR